MFLSLEGYNNRFDGNVGKGTDVIGGDLMVAVVDDSFGNDIEFISEENFGSSVVVNIDETGGNNSEFIKVVDAAEVIVEDLLVFACVDDRVGEVIAKEDKIVVSDRVGDDREVREDDNVDTPDREDIVIFDTIVAEEDNVKFKEEVNIWEVIVDEYIVVAVDDEKVEGDWDVSEEDGFDNIAVLDIVDRVGDNLEVIIEVNVEDASKVTVEELIVVIVANDWVGGDREVIGEEDVDFVVALNNVDKVGEDTKVILEVAWVVKDNVEFIIVMVVDDNDGGDREVIGEEGVEETVVLYIVERVEVEGDRDVIGEDNVEFTVVFDDLVRVEGYREDIREDKVWEDVEDINEDIILEVEEDKVEFLEVAVVVVDSRVGDDKEFIVKNDVEIIIVIDVVGRDDTEVIVENVIEEDNVNLMEVVDLDDKEVWVEATVEDDVDVFDEVIADENVNELVLIFKQAGVVDEVDGIVWGVLVGVT